MTKLSNHYRKISGFQIYWIDIYYSTLFYFYFLLFNLLIACSGGTYNNGKGLNCTGMKIQLPSFYTAISRNAR